MSKSKVVKCRKCDKLTEHKFIAKEGNYGNRTLLAIVTFGLSEAIAVTKYYRCIECGNIIDQNYI